MNTQFRTLFTLAISHGYYLSGCQDFGFIVPSDTVQALRNGKLLSKIRDGKLYVLYETDQGKALSPLEGQTLRFGLKLLNPFFSNFTNFKDFNFNTSTPVYRNTTETNRLDKAVEINLVGSVFSHDLTDPTARPVTVTLQTTNSHILQTDVITLENNRLSVSYDLTGKSADTYTVTEAYPSTTRKINYYSDVELNWQGIFGLVEIKLDYGFYTKPSDSPEYAEFEIKFTAKQETLKYYLVTNNYTETEFNQLTILDVGFTEDGRDQVNFNKVASADFSGDDIPYALLGNSDAKIVLFKSQEEVARREKARKKIQVHKNGDELIKHLPQAGVNKVNSDFIIQLSKP
jgi:hypothetical protein